MSDFPTLTVDGDPADWFGRAGSEGEALDSMCDTVRVDDLPSVFDVVRASDGDNSIVGRSLRVGDRVTLATKEWETTGWGGPIGGKTRTLQQTLVERPFATATVTNIEQGHDNKEPIFRNWLITVSDVERGKP